MARGRPPKFVKEPTHVPFNLRVPIAFRDEVIPLMREYFQQDASAFIPPIVEDAWRRRQEPRPQALDNFRKFGVKNALPSFFGSDFSTLYESPKRIFILTNHLGRFFDNPANLAGCLIRFRDKTPTEIYLNVAASPNEEEGRISILTKTEDVAGLRTFFTKVRSDSVAMYYDYYKQCLESETTPFLRIAGVAEFGSQGHLNVIASEDAVVVGHSFSLTHDGPANVYVPPADRTFTDRKAVLRSQSTTSSILEVEQSDDFHGMYTLMFSHFGLRGCAADFLPSWLEQDEMTRSAINGAQPNPNNHR